MSQIKFPPIKEIISSSFQSKTDHPFQEIIQDIANQKVTSKTMLQLEQVHNSLRHNPHTLKYSASEALQWRLGYFPSEKADNNLYLANSSIAQIDLFKLLIEELPHVAFAQQIVNDMIVNICLPHKHVVLLDIGIGTAHQCSKIIQQLAEKSSTLKEITIIGIEPSAESLVAAQKNLQNIKTEISLNFHPINSCVENISAKTWTNLAKQYQHQNVVINASFALHHIKNNEQHPNIREDVFHFLHDFHPLAVFLSEPNSNHLETSFVQRFENCLYHFNLVFKLINELAISGDEKRALKLFFGREIKDIIGNSEELRSERHELATTWIDRLRKANFQLQDNFANYLPQSTNFIDIRSTRERFLSFEYQQESLVAVMHAIPVKS